MQGGIQHCQANHHHQAREFGAEYIAEAITETPVIKGLLKPELGLLPLESAAMLGCRVQPRLRLWRYPPPKRNTFPDGWSPPSIRHYWSLAVNKRCVGTAGYCACPYVLVYAEPV